MEAVAKVDVDVAVVIGDYDPSLGRYLEVDPVGIAGELNGFAYAGSNPLNHVDPLGLVVVFTGDPATQSALQDAYNAVGNTPLGGPLENTLQNSPNTYAITNQQNGNACFDPNTNTISVNPNFHQPTMVQPPGKCPPQSQPAPTDAILGHEIGHAATGTLDDGPDNMNNVNKNENPIRKSLGEPPRIAY